LTSFRALYTHELGARGFLVDPAQAAAVDALDDLRGRLLERETLAARPRRWLALRRSQQPVHGLYLWGGVGRGKTWLMDLFFASLPFAKRQRRHFHRFMYDVHAHLKDLDRNSAPLDAVAARIAKEAHVLCFDEFFVGDIADAMILGGLLQGLFRRGVALVATSNLPPRRLYENGLQRERFLPAIALLERHMRILAVDSGTDYRLRDLTQAGTYLVSGAADTQARLDTLFNRLAGGAAAQAGAVQIEDRAIPIVREAGTAIWFEFAALCAGPRSQNDYIEIARAYQTVILADVPQFDAAREDEARRFIALVDELYDHNVKLIVSAAAAPAELYRGARLKRDFERPASRLTEMQSAQYLAREHRP
jgi:cell division protein ZapE